MNPKIGKTVSLIIPEEIRDEVTRISVKRGMSKAKVYRMLMEVGLETHRDMEKVGLIPLVDFAHFVKKVVREETSKIERQDKAGKQLNLIL